MPEAGVGGVIEFGIAGVALAFPLLALLAAIPLVLKVFVDHYVNRWSLAIWWELAVSHSLLFDKICLTMD
jgi:hypothetical protein